MIVEVRVPLKDNLPILAIDVIENEDERGIIDSNCKNV